MRSVSPSADIDSRLIPRRTLKMRRDICEVHENVGIGAPYIVEYTLEKEPRVRRRILTPLARGQMLRQLPGTRVGNEGVGAELGVRRKV